MEHIKLHHLTGTGLSLARADYALFQYLKDEKLMPSAEFKELMGVTDRRSESSGGYTWPKASSDDHANTELGRALTVSSALNTSPHPTLPHPKGLG